MKTKNVNAPFSLRFRRWSRVGYAIFCSLACTVTIGSVAVSISDKSLQKEVGVSKNTISAIADNPKSCNEVMELLELETSIQPFQETSLAVIKTDRAAAWGQNTYIYFINQNG